MGTVVEQIAWRCVGALVPQRVLVFTSDAASGSGVTLLDALPARSEVTVDVVDITAFSVLNGLGASF